MPLVKVEDAVGRQLRRPLMGPDGRVLLKEGAVLSEGDVRAVQRRVGVSMLDVTDELLPFLEPSEAELDQGVRRQAASAVSNALDALSRRTVAPTARPLFEAAAALLEAALSMDGALAALETMRSQDNALVQHSVQTSVYAVLMGYGVKLRRQDLMHVALGALVHDLGKGFLAGAILTKPGPLTDEETAAVRRHPAMGRDAILRGRDFPPEVATIVYQHHERLDGSGYPEGARAERLSRLTRIVTIADVFDALCSPRAYKAGWAPAHAAKYLRRHQELFDEDLVRVLLEHVAIYPSGSLVWTHRRHLAVVVTQNDDRPDAPVVLELANRWSMPIPPRLVDLAEEADNQTPIVAIARRWPEGLLAGVDKVEARRLVTEHLLGRRAKRQSA